MKSRHLLIGLMSTVAAGALASAALADPTARVGRVAEIDGGVSLLPPQTDTWSWASRNYPVAPGESFWTGDDGRVQLQIGLTEARLDSETELDVVDLDYGEMRLALPQGSADIRLWGSPRGGVTISTPAGDVRLDGRGLYRIDVSAPPQDGSYPTVEVTVFEGRAEAPAPEGRSSVQAGQAAVLYAGYEPQLQDAQDASIDDWGADLESREGWTPTDNNIPAVTGWSDLQGAGDFYQDPQYGRVWFPRDVPSDWAPYRYGHWAYVEPWGYTWIDDQPWGFAPFHYGRWVDFNGHWGWVPGRITAEPVYAPALVAFLGGVGWNLGGGDAIGWVPLAPDEVYRPSYRVSDDYVRRLNVTSVRTTIINNVTVNTTTNVTTVYRNAPAATVVRTAAFSSAQPVHRVAIPVTAAMIAQAPAARGASPPPPTAAARLGSNRPVNAGAGASQPATASRPPAALQAVHVAVVAAPPHAGAPPAIVGARIAAAPPRPAAAAAAPVLVAPAQIHHPQPQGSPAPASRPSAATAPSRPGFALPPPRPSPPPPTRPEMSWPATPPPPPAAGAARQGQAEAQAQAEARQQAQAREAAARQAEAAAAARQAQQADAARQAQEARAQAQARTAQEAEQARQAQQAQQAAEQKAREAQARAAHPAPPKKGPDGKPTKPGDAPQ